MIYFEEDGVYLEKIVLDQTNGYLYFAATLDSSSTGYIFAWLGSKAKFTQSTGYIGVINPSNFNSKTLITSLRYVHGLAIYPSKG